VLCVCFGPQSLKILENNIFSNALGLENRYVSQTGLARLHRGKSHQMRLVACIVAGTFCGAPALAADMAVKAPLAPPAPVSSWTGFYVGAELGVKREHATWATTSVIDAGTVITTDASSPRSYDASGVRGGIYLGYNRQFASRWVGGVEFDWADARKTTNAAGIPGCSILCLGAPGPVADSSSVTMGWDASARARLGYLLTPDLLLYGTGGAAWQRVESSATCQFSGPDPLCPGIAGTPFATASISATRTGWTIGSGIDARISEHWILRGEYRYAAFGTWNVQTALSAGGLTTNLGYQLKINTQLATLGIAYKFAP
jgi:outer membrane immunogenic protein